MNTFFQKGARVLFLVKAVTPRAMPLHAKPTVPGTQAALFMFTWHRVELQKYFRYICTNVLILHLIQVPHPGLPCSLAEKPSTSVPTAHHANAAATLSQPGTTQHRPTQNRLAPATTPQGISPHCKLNPTFGIRHVSSRLMLCCASNLTQ